MDDFLKSNALDSVRQEVKNFGFLICNTFAVAMFAAPAVTPWSFDVEPWHITRAWLPTKSQAYFSTVFEHKSFPLGFQFLSSE